MYLQKLYYDKSFIYPHKIKFKKCQGFHLFEKPLLFSIKVCLVRDFLLHIFANIPLESSSILRKLTSFVIC